MQMSRAHSGLAPNDRRALAFGHVWPGTLRPAPRDGQDP